MPQNKDTPAAQPGLRITTQLYVPDDQEAHLPKRRRAPRLLPPEAPLPRVGDIVYLSSSSGWCVELVVHDWHSPVDLHIEVWISYVGGARQGRHPDFSSTQ